VTLLRARPFDRVNKTYSFIGCDKSFSICLILKKILKFLFKFYSYNVASSLKNIPPPEGGLGNKSSLLGEKFTISIFYFKFHPLEKVLTCSLFQKYLALYNNIINLIVSCLPTNLVNLFYYSYSYISYNFIPLLVVFLSTSQASQLCSIVIKTNMERTSTTFSGIL